LNALRSFHSLLVESAPRDWGKTPFDVDLLFIYLPDGDLVVVPRRRETGVPGPLLAAQRAAIVIGAFVQSEEGVTRKCPRRY
jgi:hypothetical protein